MYIKLPANIFYKSTRIWRKVLLRLTAIFLELFQLFVWSDKSQQVMRRHKRSWWWFGFSKLYPSEKEIKQIVNVFHLYKSKLKWKIRRNLAAAGDLLTSMHEILVFVPLLELERNISGNSGEGNVSAPKQPLRLFLNSNWLPSDTFLI